LEPLFDLEVFEGRAQVSFEKVLREGTSISLRALPTDETKLAAAEFLLRWLWCKIQKVGEVQGRLRLIVVLDEAHELAYEHSPVSELLRRGRKYGISVLLLTQQPDDFESKELVFQNCAVHVAFGCNSERHARAMAKEMLGAGEAAFDDIRKLNKFEALISSHGDRTTKKVRVIPYYKLVDKGTGQSKA
jgi:DNA helicase HerA-like ATPase